MSQTCSDGSDGGPTRRAAGSGPAEWLSLAAAPTFAILALVTGFFGAPMDICSAGPVASPFGGMALMYLLMSAFHASPWLKLNAHRRNAGRRP